MANEQLATLIQEYLRRGASREEIKQGLLLQHWPESEIEEAFIALGVTAQPAPTPSPVPGEAPAAAPAPAPAPAPEAVVGPPAPAPKRAFPIVPLLIIAAAAGACFAATSPIREWIHSRQPPEKILQTATERWVEAKSLEYSGQIRVDVEMTRLQVPVQPPGQPAADEASAAAADETPSPETPPALPPPPPPAPEPVTQRFGLVFTFTGTSDIRKIEEPLGTFVMHGKFDLFPLSLMSFGGEARVIGKTVYFRATDLPAVLKEKAPIQDEWIRVNLEDLQKRFGNQVQTAQLTPEQMERMKKVWKEARVMKVVERLPDEKVNGLGTFHYRVIFERDRLKELFEKLLREVAELSKDERASEEKIREAGTQIRKVLDSVPMPEGELWIGKRNLLPTKASFASTFRQETPENKVSASVQVAATFSNYNKPVKVEAPSSWKELDQVSEELGKLGIAAPAP